LWSQVRVLPGAQIYQRKRNPAQDSCNNGTLGGNREDTTATVTTNHAMTTVALEALRNCRTELYAAQLDCLDAARRLTGARAARADQLAARIGECLALTRRLASAMQRVHTRSQLAAADELNSLQVDEKRGRLR
jgi:hypothetical protein